MRFETAALSDALGLPMHHLDDLWAQIEPDLAHDIKTYIHYYGFGVIGQALKRLEDAQNGHPSAWAKQWAKSLSSQDVQAWQYNRDCVLCLNFLYRIIKNHLVTAFMPYRVGRIVRTCLVMDRANALYNMVDHNVNARGLYWFAEVDRDLMKGLLKEPQELNRLCMSTSAPLDPRLRALLDIDELGFKNDEDICGWMTPQKPE